MLDLNIETDVVPEDSDYIPESREYTVASNVYPTKILLAYMDESVGGAKCLKLIFEAEPFKEFKFNQTLYLTSGLSKGQKTSYTDTSGVKRPLPGFSMADHLSLVTTGKHIHELSTEVKVIKLWSYDKKAEVPTQVQALTDLIGKVFEAGIYKNVENKKIKIDNNWVPTSKKREYNEVAKIFNVDGLTVAEMNAKATKPEFKDKWIAKYENKDMGKYDPSVKDPDDIPAKHIESPKPTESIFS